MPTSKQIERIAELTAMIAELPKGYISEKNINGKVYFYHQWSENSCKKSKYVRDDEIKELSEKLEKRRHLQEELRILKKSVSPIRINSGSAEGELNMMKYILMVKINFVE